MTPRIGLGIAVDPFTSGRAFFRFVDRCESGGVDSLWQTDRQQSKQPYLEAMATMAALAGATSRMKFGMNAIVASLRDPLLLAKQCATIDHLSNGRLLPVFGAGAEFAPEWKATGRSPRGRGKRTDEALTIMQRLWTEESVTFTGEHYQYENASIAPRPVQQPLPCWIGGHSKAAIQRTATLGTGWLAGIQTPSEVAPVIAAIREASAAAGRPIPDDHYGAGFPYRFGTMDDALVQAVQRAQVASGGSPKEQYVVVGNAQTILDRIAAYQATGVSKFVLIPIARGDEDMMDQVERLIAEVIPAAEAAAA